MPMIPYLDGLEVVFGYGDVILGEVENDDSVGLIVQQPSPGQKLVPGATVPKETTVLPYALIFSFPKYNNDSLQILIDKLTAMRDSNYPPNYEDGEK